MINYTIQPGDTLRAIARKFGFQDWHPIWVFNHDPRISPSPRLSIHNPDRISPGITILIPRTRAEYDQVIQALQRVKQEVDRSFREQQEELNRLGEDMERFGAKVDLAADLAMAGKGGVKALLKLGPRYRDLVLAKRAFEAMSSIFIYYSGQKDMPVGAALAGTRDAAAEQVIPVLTKTGFEPGQFLSGSVKGTAKEGIKQAAQYAAVKAARAVGHAELASSAKDVVGIACDFAIKGEKALESIPPSFLAKSIIWIVDRENPDATLSNAKHHVETSRMQSARLIQQTIDKLLTEQRLLYGM